MDDLGVSSPPGGGATRGPSAPPVVSVPKGGGAIRGLGEKFSTAAVTGTGALTLPIPMSNSRAGFAPALDLSYDSGRGNGIFGFGWDLSLASISRKTDQGLPRYDDSDVFLLSGAEDLVPVNGPDAEIDGFRVQRFRPRIEGLFARIERWSRGADGDVHWRSISRDNVTTLYGRDANSRISDPREPGRVFSWLICGSHDDKGNAASYVYAAENSANLDTLSAHEAHRSALHRSANRHIRRVLYGNRTPQSVGQEVEPGWMFEVDFDYGVGPDGDWDRRTDPFSTYRPGFEVRTYRLCRRILMRHHFPDELDVGTDAVVRELEFTYDEAANVGMFLVAATKRGHRRVDGQVRTRAMPPVEFTYSKVELQQGIEELVLGERPRGPAAPSGHWVDLDGEGIAGLMQDQGESWYYRPNMGGGALGPARLLANIPSTGAKGMQFLDLAGDGRLDVVDLDKGFYERTADGAWENFRAFRGRPETDWADPNLRLVDLDGDGHADVLVTDGDSITWHRSLGEEGFGPAETRADGPAATFGAGDVHLADMSGDGLSDLVRIRNGEICYWPNLGRGAFGSRVVMDDSPRFDRDELFEPQRIRLVDVDGSGVTDVVYCGPDTVSVYFNRSGNGWSPRQRIDVAAGDRAGEIEAVDLFGRGTACLVWPSNAPGAEGHRLRFLDLLGGGKPHLLTRVETNLGSRVEVEYAPSTTFYLEDKAAGRPWRTRLPFPVQLVRRVVTTDLVTRNVFVTRYAYHHGYFDGADREFRGFGLVDKWDADLAEGPDQVPPVWTRTWYHTGTDTDATAEQWHAPGAAEIGAGECQVPGGLGSVEWHEAQRALKSSMLRQEVYALDGSDRENLPYSVTEHSYAVRIIQPLGNNTHAVCFAHPLETVNRHYERHLYDVVVAGDKVRRADPRVLQQKVLEVDDWGNALQSLTIAHPRRFPSADLDPLLGASAREHIEQSQLQRRATLAVNSFTNAVVTEHDHRAPLPAETRSYELIGTDDPDVPDVPFEADGVAGPGRRLVERSMTRYRRDDLGGVLPAGQVESKALSHQTYQLAFTPEVLDRAFGALLDEPVATLGAEAGYELFEGSWWIPSGTVAYSPGDDDTPAQERAYADAHFFLPMRYVDMFGGRTQVSYDKYDLLVLDTVDPVGNRVSAGERSPGTTPDVEPLVSALDYQALAPRMVSDANRNRNEVLFDALGMVAATAVRGKPELGEGDSLAGVEAHPSEAEILSYFDVPGRVLGAATSRTIYDLFGFHRTRDDAAPQPVAVATLSRETHGTTDTQVGHRIVYADGLGHEMQTKAVAEPETSGGPSRWASSGWIIYSNKGKPVRRFEPFFTQTHRFEADVRAGVSAISCYDPLGRVVATLLPDGSYTKAVFSPWRTDNWDGNDTVLLDPRTDPDVAGLAHPWLSDAGSKTWHQRRVSGELGLEEKSAAKQTAAHAATPASGYADTLGRTIASVSANAAERYTVRYVLDVEGAKREIIDARDVVVLKSFFDVAGRAVHTQSPDSGDQRVLPDVSGVPVRRWDARGHRFRHRYDPLRRGTQIWLGESLVGLTQYGEAVPNATTNNLRGKPHLVFDGAGQLESVSFDFKGNLLASRRRLALEFSETVDWSTLGGLPATQVPAAAEALLEGELFAGSATYDALNRPTVQGLPNGTVVTSTYNEAGLLETLTEAAVGEPQPTVVLAGASYNAKGLRESAEFGNGARSTYEYDPSTFRLRKLSTTRGSAVLQALSYVYDPVGNVVAELDESKQTVFFAGQVVKPGASYVYDSLYRLVEAKGREHASLAGPPDRSDLVGAPLPHPNDTQALRSYTQRYSYDPAGNLTRQVHVAEPGGWSSEYAYAKDSNRLLSHITPDGEVAYTHDEQGNMTALPRLESLTWDHDDQLASADLGPGGPVAHYTYDGAGTRVRKVVEHQGALVEERVRLPGYEVYRRRLNGTVTMERSTIHIGDDRRRIAMVEVTTLDQDQPLEAGARRYRYQLESLNHSAAIELDETAAVISYEEYHPYGTTSIWLTASAAEVSAKRYRYTGKERDEETGLYYYGARYYAPWLARWTSYDPTRPRDGESPYMYVQGNPIRFFDPDGNDCGEQHASIPVLSALLPGHTGYAVRPQVNPCLANHPDPRVQEWGKWKAEADKDAALSAAAFNRDVAAVAAGTTTAFYTVAYAGVTLGAVGTGAAEQAMVWALSNPAKMALAETLLQFGIGIIDPHPPGLSPMDLPGPADDLGRAARGAIVKRVEATVSSSDLVNITARYMKPKQLLDAVKSTWDLDKQGLAMWRGEILEGALASTRYRFMEWVGKNNGGFFKGLDFYAQKVGIQLKTLQAVPKVSEYKGFLDNLLVLKQSGVTADGRALESIGLHIAIPEGFRGPLGKQTEFVNALRDIVDYGKKLGIPVTVFETSEKEVLNVIHVAK